MESYYRNIPKKLLLDSPSQYAWNIALRYVQFTQSELLQVRDYYSIKDLIKFQDASTKGFIIQHFFHDVNESLDVDWDDVEKYCEYR